MSEVASRQSSTLTILLSPFNFDFNGQQSHGVNFYEQTVGFGSLYESELPGMKTYPGINRSFEGILVTKVVFSDLNVPPIVSETPPDFYQEDEAKNIIKAAIDSLASKR